nr:TRAP transporter small permease subunit [Pseudovibrio flavus]
MQVMCRSFFDVSILWLDEVALMCFMWTIMLGAAVGLRRQVHYLVESIPDTYPLPSLILKLFAHVVVAIMIYVFIDAGWGYTKMSMWSFSTALSVPWGYVYVSLPLSALFMIPFWVEAVMKDIQAYRNYDIAYVRDFDNEV